MKGSEHPAVAVAAVAVVCGIIFAATTRGGYGGSGSPSGGPAATKGAPFIAQPYDPARLRGINAYEPKQRQLDKMFEEVAKANTLGNAKITVVSWEPRILVVDDFMSTEEADHLIETIGGANRLGSTAVVTTDGGAAVLDNTVTSKIGSFPGKDPIVRGVNERIAQLSFLPYSWGETLHVIHYDPGQYFRGHLDVHAKPGRKTSSRVATCFLYLSDVVKGGETYFPLAKKAEGGRDPPPQSCVGYEGKDPEMQDKKALESYFDGSEFFNVTEEERATLGVVVRPKKGRAVLWWNRMEDGEIDWRSRHAGCPLLEGEKWAATRWIHHEPFGGWGSSYKPKSTKKKSRTSKNDKN